MNRTKLAIVWLSADKRAAADMALLYARDCLINNWFCEVELILWGPVVDIAATDEAIQTELAILKNLGGKISVCKACALRYGVAQRLSDLGYKVDGMGEHLTTLLTCKIPLLLI